VTAPDTRKPQVLDRPACAPSAIRAVLAANAAAAVLRRYDADLDAAYEQAREDGNLTPLVETVWPPVSTWSTPRLNDVDAGGQARSASPGGWCRDDQAPPSRSPSAPAGGTLIWGSAVAGL